MAYRTPIAKARGLSEEQINEVNDGRIWRGGEAVAKGLIDAVMSYDEALDELASSLEPSNTGDKPMSNTDTPKPRAARRSTKPVSEDVEKEEPESEEIEDEETTTEEDKDKPSSAASSIAAIQRAVPKAGSSFVLKAVQKGWTPDQARMKWLEQTVQSQSKQIEALESQSPKAGNKAVGVGKEGISFSGDAEKSWKSAIKEKTDEGMSRADAVRSLEDEMARARPLAEPARTGPDDAWRVTRGGCWNASEGSRRTHRSSDASCPASASAPRAVPRRPTTWRASGRG